MHPKKVLAKKLFYQLKICLSPKKICFLGKTFYGCTFYQGHMYIFEISTKRRIFWGPFDLFKEKSFHLLGQWTFLRTKKVKNGRNHSKLRKTVFYKQILDFHCPSKILCHTSNLWNSLPFQNFMSHFEFMKFCQNHWSLVYTVALHMLK